MVQAAFGSSISGRVGRVVEGGAGGGRHPVLQFWVQDEPPNNGMHVEGRGVKKSVCCKNKVVGSLVLVESTAARSGIYNLLSKSSRGGHSSSHFSTFLVRSPPFTATLRHQLLS